MTIAMFEGGTVNPRMTADLQAIEVVAMTQTALANRDPKTGAWVANLATAVPDPSNGLVSPNGLNVTWHLKPNLKWSDGTPLTSDDLRFTWEVCGPHADGCARTDGLRDVTSVDTPNATTIVLHYRKLYLGYKGQWLDGVLPRHSKYVGPASGIANWRYNRTANPSSGPFMVKTWQSGDHMILVRNPYYYLPGRPYLNQVDILFRTDPEVQRQLVLSGEADITPDHSNPVPSQVEQMVKRGFALGGPASNDMGHFQINPHDPQAPELRDPRVREAILVGTNVNGVLASWYIPGLPAPRLGTSRFDIEPAFAGCIPRVQYDPSRAAALLDAAGWVKNPSTGIRMKNGKSLHLRVSTYTGYGQEPSEIVWISQLRALGIDAVAQNYDGTTFYAGYNDGGIMARGNFDLLYYDWSRDIPDIQSETVEFDSTAGIPSTTNPDGRNFLRFSDPQIDQWVNEAGSTPDIATQRTAYCHIANRMTYQLWLEEWTGFLPTYAFSNPRLKGWNGSELYAFFGQDIQNWYFA